MNQEEVITLIIILMIAGGVGLSFGFGQLRETSSHTLKRYLAGMTVCMIQAVRRVVMGYLLIIGGITMLGFAMTTEVPPAIKLIILDIDGVLNHNKATERVDTYLYDPECVDRLNILIATHKAKIVVCSAWRIGQTVESMQGILNSIGVKGQVIGITPDLRGNHTRDDEITTWLQNYGNFEDIEGFVLIDDDDSERFAGYQVTPSWDNFGMLSEHLHQADSMLSRKMPDEFDIGKVEVCELEVKEETSFGGHSIQSGPSSSPKRS